MKPILIVVDMQNDFVDGALGTPEARAIVPDVCARIERAKRDGEALFATLDTHSPDYLTTAEGRALPVEHCVKGSGGHGLNPEVRRALGDEALLVEKPGFGSERLSADLAQVAADSGYPDGAGMIIELCGVCTDICVVTNALLIKTRLPEAELIVRAHLCAGVTEQKHQAALEVMRSCQVKVLE